VDFQLRQLCQTQEVVAEITAAGGQAITPKADMANVADAVRLFKETVDDFQQARQSSQTFQGGNNEFYR
jgi:hypothetical protein